jgi:hypothetical protein
MGMFATITVDESVDLPHFPDEELGRGNNWQSKQLDVHGGPYRISADGRLERKEKSFRTKTDAEKKEEAKKWGCDSWGEYCQLYEDNESLTWPDELDWSEDEHGYMDTPPTFSPSEEVVDEVWWADHNMHGSFEFHQVFKENPVLFETMEDPASGEAIERPTEHELDVYLSYEARFTKSDLDEIVLLGGRGSEENVVEQIESWLESCN